jgi:hypothetical protein
MHGNPETAADPTGHYRCDETGCSRGHHNHGRGGCTYDCGSGGNGGSHGGGNNGKGKSKGDPPKPCPDGTYASCNFASDYGPPTNETAATRAARDVEDNLAIWAAALGGLALLLGAISVEQPWLVFVLTAIIRVVATLAVEATLLAAEFAKEADQNISISNLQTFQDVVGGTIALFTGAFVVLGGFFQSVLSKAVGCVVGGALGFDLFGNVAMNGVAQIANALYS